MFITFLLILILKSEVFSACPSECNCTSNRIDCSRRGLATVPRHLPSETRSIDLNGNDIETISDKSFAGLNVLSSIDLSDNSLRFIDDSVFSLPNISHINLRKNKLTTIPKKLENLDRIDLSSNHLTKLSTEDIVSLSLVKTAELSRNRITSWPKKTTVRNGLTQKLDLSGNSLREMPPNAFLGFANLRNLRLHRNRIQTIDKDSFKGLQQLEILDISRNNLSSLESLLFDSLAAIQHISLARNNIENLDDGVFLGCSSLLFLNLSSNRISHLSDGWLFGLHNLQKLDLSNNEIAQIDKVVWRQVPNLKLLLLNNNQLTSLPSGLFSFLNFLEELQLAENLIKSLHKTTFTGLDRLYSLDLSSNNLAFCVEEESVLYNTSLPFLRSLKFRNNQLKIVPSRAFSRFPMLEDIDLIDNPITTIQMGAFEPLRLKNLLLRTSSVLCDCHIAWFSEWLYLFGVKQDNIEMKCSHPNPFKDIEVTAIDPANLTCVDDSPRARIIEQPNSVLKTIVNSEISLKCKGYGYQPIMVTWQKVENGRARKLEENQHISISDNSTTVFNGTSNGQELIESHLMIRNISLSDDGEYQCIASNQYSKDYGIRTHLQVHQPPIFLHEPDDMTILVGQNAKINCAATGVPSPMLHWSKDDGSEFPAAEERRLHVKHNDDHLYIINISSRDQGVYTCHASNEAGSIQASAMMRVYDNMFRSQFEDHREEEGTAVILDCSADINATTQRIEWKKDGNPIERRSDIVLNVYDQLLIIKKLLKSDAGVWECELWAGATLLSSQKSTIEVILEDNINNNINNNNGHRKRRWLTVSSALLVTLLLLICGICLSILCYRRRKKSREIEVQQPVSV